MTKYQSWAGGQSEAENTNKYQQDNSNLSFCPVVPVANDDLRLHEELEQRYGAAFAQWIMDDLRKASVI